MRLAALPLLLAPLLLSPLAQAAALSVCTEASPEGFDVVQYNSLTTTNASADCADEPPGGLRQRQRQSGRQPGR
jgi:hypothetical protein